MFTSQELSRMGQALESVGLKPNVMQESLFYCLESYRKVRQFWNIINKEKMALKYWM